MLFRKNRGITAPSIAKEELLRGYRWLDKFKHANEGDEYLRKVMERYTRFIDLKREYVYFDKLGEEAIKWQKKLASRPILTGGFIRPTFFNPPLPRMKPQPVAINKMIRRRMRKYTERMNALVGTREMISHLKTEAQFEKGLKQMHPEANIPSIFSSDAYNEWVQFYEDKISESWKLHAREIERARTPFPPDMVDMVKAARRNKIENKTRERERERRGEILKSTIKRMRKAPPAHVLATMTPEQKRMDRIARSVSEVGYVALVKMKLGHKLRDPESWKKELSLEKKEELDQLAEWIRTDNWEKLEAASRKGGGTKPRE